jgi:mannosyltransferase
MPSVAPSPADSAVIETPSFPSRRSALALTPTLTPTLTWACLGVVVLVAAFLRLHDVAAKSFWLDEGISTAVARLRWPQFFLAVWNREANMVLYTALLHLWMKLGSGEAFVRGLSVLFSVATVPLLYALGARLFGRSAGLVAAWLLAINAYHVRYAQEARSYTLVVFLAVLSTWLFVRNIQEPAEPRWGAYSVVSALVVYAHFLGALMVVAHAVSLLWLGPPSVPWRDSSRNSSGYVWRDFLRSMRWFALCISPGVIAAVHVGGGTTSWIQPPTRADVMHFFEFMAGNRGVALAILEAALLVVAVLAIRRRRLVEMRSLENWGLVLVLAWLFVPLAAVLAVSVVRPVFLGRYMIFCLPALLLGVAAGITRLRPAAISLALCAALSVLCVQGTASYYRQDFDLSREDWRSATSYILDHAQPGDGIFFLTFGRLSYEYYKSLRQPAAQGPVVLNWPGGPEPEYRDFLVRPVAEMLGDARPAPDRVWLVLFLDHDAGGRVNPTSTILRAWFGKGRRLIREQEFPQITICLFAKDSAALDDSSGRSR